MENKDLLNKEMASTDGVAPRIVIEIGAYMTNFQYELWQAFRIVANYFVEYKQGIPSAVIARVNIPNTITDNFNQDAFMETCKEYEALGALVFILPIILEELKEAPIETVLMELFSANIKAFCETVTESVNEEKTVH